MAGAVLYLSGPPAMRASLKFVPPRLSFKTPLKAHVRLPSACGERLVRFIRGLTQASKNIHWNGRGCAHRLEDKVGVITAHQIM
jgi:hypothetical protein